MKAKRLEQMAVYVATVLCAQALMAAEQTDQTQGQQTTKDSSAQSVAQSTGGVRISKLKGANVKSKSGENLGKLEDLVLDPRTGQITFAIVGKGRLLGLGDKSRPIPWQDVTVNSEKEVTLNMEKQKMESAPTVNSDYSDLDNPDNVLVIYRFYEIQPAGTAGETPGGTQEGSSQSRTNNPANPQP